MFTGHVEQIGKVESIEDRRGQRKIKVQTSWNDLQAGETVCVSGVALTVTDAKANGQATIFLPEDLYERSTLHKLEKDSRVNLERALQFGSRMGGHTVQGNVDARGLVLSNVDGGDHYRFTVALDPKYGKYCVENGSISIDGVSLSVKKIIETRNKEFMVTFHVIPHMWKSTTFSELKTGDLCNVEVDILAKYIERLCPQLEEIVSNQRKLLGTESAPQKDLTLEQFAAYRAELDGEEEHATEPTTAEPVAEEPSLVESSAPNEAPAEAAPTLTATEEMPPSSPESDERAERDQYLDSLIDHAAEMAAPSPATETTELPEGALSPEEPRHDQPMA